MGMEAKRQAKVLKWLKTVPKCKAIKVITANEAGTPDVHICYRGRYIVWECKAPGQKLRPHQYARIRQYADAGACMIDPHGDIDEFKALMERIDYELDC